MSTAVDIQGAGSEIKRVASTDRRGEELAKDIASPQPLAKLERAARVS